MKDIAGGVLELRAPPPVRHRRLGGLADLARNLVRLVTAAGIDAAARRIVRVSAHPLRVTLPAVQRTAQGDWSAIEIVVVEVEVAGGWIGFGECLARRGSTAYAGFIETVLRPLLLGEDLLDRRRLWRRMRSVLTGRTGGMLVEAIAGVDIALWDLAGHSAGQSVAQLLGGMGRRTTPVYASSINWFDDAAVEREVASAVAAGFRSIKVKVGRPVGAAQHRVRLVRQLAGDAIELSADANWAYDLHDAIAVGRVMADCGYVWFEEPLRPEDRRGYRLLRDQLPIRLAAGESDYAAVDALELIEDRSVGLIQPDVARSGGITETWRIAELAQCFGVAYAPHVGWSGAICLAASLQLAAAAENCITAECMVFANPLREQMLKVPVGLTGQLVDGQMPVPDGPNLGIEVDRGFLAAHRVRE
ncbi:mandelate racemase/muconate lactonizing enzyme family protein [Caenimonas soli]|uniref:mandelate racemase/muconate lactonizing enzyme family protein n=1 Tax=Caenimonas soli TaxID=2735555 RepID=UPI001A9AB909|nr:mandelate racemase/muconate lactonizing enzyme family protein [Caenimonas soli]